MFERYTEDARKAIVAAQDEARRFNHNYIGTEHLLLGLLADREIATALFIYDKQINVILFPLWFPI